MMKGRMLVLVAFLTLALALSCSTGKDKVDDTPGTGEVSEVAVSDVADANGVLETVEPQDGAGDVPGSDVCQPNCDGKECGDDGCGGTCGSCCPGIPCIDGICNCAPLDCSGKECGPDGCCGSCGECPAGFECVDWKCEDTSDPCFGKQCGPDGEGGSCGTCPCEGCHPCNVYCDEGQCMGEHDCPCIFECFGVCLEGDQACLQNCINDSPIEAQMAFNSLMECINIPCYYIDECPVDPIEECPDEYYACFPPGDLDCEGVYLCLSECGGDDQECVVQCFDEGSIEALEVWDEYIDCMDLAGYFECPDDDDACYEQAEVACATEFNACLGCTPNCEGKECGDDGCSGSCGECEGPKNDCVEGECQAICDCLDDADCQPAEDFDLCNGKLVCGLTMPCMCELDPDSVVECPDGQVCAPETGACCSPSCEGKECGSDGCGGECGSCGPGEDCVGSDCSWNNCEPGKNGGCASSNSFFVCNEESSAFLEVPCESPWLLCVDGECLDVECVPGDVECQGMTATKECLPEGVWSQPQNCPEGTMCIEADCVVP
jgi:hypothetical protein